MRQSYVVYLQEVFADIHYQYVFRRAFVGQAAPDADVVNIQTLEKKHLLSYANPGRPLILNFGSSSWLPFA